MSESADPSAHRLHQEQFLHHVESLLGDDRLRLDTQRGRRPVTQFMCEIKAADKTVELTRLMSELNRPDRDLRDHMPTDPSLDVTFSRRRFFFRRPVSKMWVQCVSPSRALLSGQSPQPLGKAQLSEILRQAPAPNAKAPATLIIMSTSGFAPEAGELAQRTEGRTVVLASPNDAGGWTVIAPPDTKGLSDLFDPEAVLEKRRRVRQIIEESRADLSSSGLAGDHIAARSQLPIAVVEAELKLYAKENPGLAAKRLDGKMVLFRQAAVALPTGGTVMPMIDKMKALFARKGETEKKIEFLSERRTALSQQRDRGYEEIGDLESREADLRKQFKEAPGDLTKRRITSQLLQIRKDMERRQQLMGVLNQQINVVATHLHNLELVRQGKTAQLPDSEEMASDAAAAEEVLAELQASGELADSVGITAQSGLSAEEQALFDELENEGKPPEPQAAPSPAAPQARTPAAARTEPRKATTKGLPSEPEAG